MEPHTGHTSEKDPAHGSPGGKSKPNSPPASPSKSDPAKTEGPASKSGSQGSGQPESPAKTPLPAPGTPAIEWNRFPEEMTSRRTKGLGNDGNFCYRNATLQALLHLPGFYRYMRGMQHSCLETSKKDLCVACALKALTFIYWHGQDAIDFTRRGDDSLGDDAWEAALDGPHAALKTFNNACGRNLPEAKEVRREFIKLHQSDPYDFLQYLLEHIGRKESPEDINTFANMFAMPLETSWTCADCGETTTTKTGGAEALSVGIQDPRPGLTLTEYVAHELEDLRRVKCDNKTCPGTSAKSKMDKEEGPVRHWQKRIVSSPEIMVIRMIRYGSYIDKKGRLQTRKIFDDVAFEELLDLSDFAGEDCVYRLDAVVAHSGKDIHRGHIIAAVRDFHGEQFHIINDDAVLGPSKRGRGEFAELQHPICQGSEKQPYMLFYSKLN